MENFNINVGPVNAFNQSNKLLNLGADVSMSVDTARTSMEYKKYTSQL